VLTQVDVTLEKLPDRWRHRTIVQLSDLHLGHFHTPASMQRLAERVNALAPDLVVITGDLFDGMADGMPEFVEPLRQLSSPLGVFFVTGNHEVYAGLGVAWSSCKKQASGCFGMKWCRWTGLT